jgi:hypothetical protein
VVWILARIPRRTIHSAFRSADRLTFPSSGSLSVYWFSTVVRGYVRLAAVTRSNACFAATGQADTHLPHRVGHHVHLRAPIQNDVGLSSATVSQRKSVPLRKGALEWRDTQTRRWDTTILSPVVWSTRERGSATREKQLPRPGFMPQSMVIELEAWRLLGAERTALTPAR